MFQQWSVLVVDAMDGLNWLPVLIFFAEMAVVTVGTLRIIFVARGAKFLAPCLGFFEILMWLFAIGQVMSNLSEPACFIAFALGFTLGNYLGILVEKKLALGSLLVRLITNRDASGLVHQLRAANFGVTCVQGEGSRGPVQVVFTVLKRKQLDEVVEMIERHHPNAFYTVDQVQAAEGGFPMPSRLGLVPSSSAWLARVKSRLLPFDLPFFSAEKK